MHLLGRLQAVNLHRALGRAAFAVERLGLDLHLNRFLGRLPIVGIHRRLQRRVADPNAPRGRAGFARTVGHVRGDVVNEDRLALLGHGAVRHGVERDLEPALAIGFGGTVSDFLLRLLPTVPPVPPGREPHFAHDAVADLTAIDRRAGVRLGLARQYNVLTQPRRVVRGIQGNFELGPLVFFHSHPGIPLRPIGNIDHHLARQPVRRRRETAAERAVFVGLMHLPRDLLAVHVVEDHRHLPPGQHFVIVVDVVNAVAQTFVLDGLTRPVQRPIREDRGLLIRARLGCFGCVVGVFGRDFLVVPVHLDGKMVLALVTKRHMKQAVGVGLRFGPPHPLVGPVIVVQDLHGCVFNRLAAVGKGHQAANRQAAVLVPNNQGQLADPDPHEMQHVVVCRKIIAVTGDEDVVAGFEVLRRLECVRALLVIVGSREFGRPRLDRREPHQLLVVNAVVSPSPVDLHHPEMEPVDVAVRDLDQRPGRVPHPFRRHFERAIFNLLDQVMAQLAPGAIGMQVLALGGHFVGIDEFFLGLKRLAPVIVGQAGQGVIAMPLGKPLERGDVGVIFRRADGLIVAKG